MTLQWSVYAVSVCIFHWLEFITTCIFNSSECTAESFLIAHSSNYTAAVISSCLEFSIKFVYYITKTIIWKFYNRHEAKTEVDGSSNINNRLSTLTITVWFVALTILVLGQTLRTMAMQTAGRSFNHYIQTSKKDKHVLITHGVYKIWRHPSYVGYFYYTIALQLVLGNVVNTILLTIVSWNFFNRRIAYEEAALHQLFPNNNEYANYVQSTYAGIPFMQQASTVPTKKLTTTTTTTTSSKPTQNTNIRNINSATITENDNNTVDSIEVSYSSSDVNVGDNNEYTKKEE